MHTNKNEVWLSSYLYYDGSPDDFLTGKVAPFVQEIIDKDLASHYFFIRYGDGHGPHIRVRFKGGKTRLQKTVKPLIRKAFPTVRFVDYEPETERYGGDVGLIIAEQLFEDSSSATLALMKASDAWTYGRALSGALQLHIGMVSAFGLPRDEVRELFGHIASHYHQNEPEKIAQFDTHLAQNQSTLPRLKALWDACEKGAALQEQWFATWQKSMHATHHKLRAAHQKKQLALQKAASHGGHELWLLYESYIHMTNNRLGLMRADESFTAHLLEKSLEL